MVFNETYVAVTAHLEVGPLFVDLLLLSIHHFLDLLDLMMHLNELSSAHGLGIAEFVGAALENVKYSSNVVGGCSFELVLLVVSTAQAVLGCRKYKFLTFAAGCRRGIVSPSTFS